MYIKQKCAKVLLLLAFSFPHGCFTNVVKCRFIMYDFHTELRAGFFGACLELPTAPMRVLFWDKFSPEGLKT